MDLTKLVVRVLILTMPMLILPQSVFADVIPTKGKAKAAKSDVQGAMVERGIDGDDAVRLASQMTPDDAAYFSGRPERVQMVSGIMFEEWVGAAILVVGIPLGIAGTLAAIRIYGD